MKALLALGRDRLVALVAIFVLGVSALPFIGWYADLEEILPRAPDPLSALNTPITILWQAPGESGTNAVPSLVWIPLVLAAVVGLASLFRPRLRRILYLVCAFLGIALLGVLWFQFGRYVSAADAVGGFSHVAVGQFVFLAGCVLCLVAGLLVRTAGKRGRHDSSDTGIREGHETGAHDEDVPVTQSVTQPLAAAPPNPAAPATRPPGRAPTLAGPAEVSTWGPRQS